MLFSGCMRAARELPKTGEGPLDIQDTALKLYRERSNPPTDFKFITVYNFISTKPKFNAMLEEMGRKERGPEKAAGKREIVQTPIDMTSEGDSTPSRPIGEKKAKKARLAEDERSKDRQKMFDLLRTRTSTVQESNDLALAMVNLDAMPPSLRGFLKQSRRPY